MRHSDSISLKQLRALAAVGETGNITAAADRLGLTPPAISSQLRTLEANIDTVLIDRDRAGMPLTPEGRELAAAASQIDSVLYRCVERIQAIKSGMMGHVRLGVVSTGKYFAPGFVAAARKKIPEIELSLHLGNRRKVVAMLRDAEVDLAIMGRPPREPAVEAEIMGLHPHIFVAAPDHPLVGAASISPDALLAETFLIREQGSGTRILASRFLDRLAEGREYDTIEFASNETIKQAVIAGLGIAMLSAHTVVAELETRRLALLKVAGTPIERNWFVVRPTAVTLSPAAVRLQRFILESAPELLPSLKNIDA